MSRSSITTDPGEWLHNSHAGELLALEFMEPIGLSIDELAASLQIAPARLQAVIDGSAAMDGDLDLRLARYFGMSEGFFLGLQVDYEIVEARRAANGELDRIVPRAA